MNPFDVWLIVVGLAIGAGLAWLVMLDLRRRDDDLAAGESAAEAAWIADTLRAQGIAADTEAVEEVLRLHRAYLAGIPDDGGATRIPESVAREDEDEEAEFAPEIPAREPAADLPTGAGEPALGEPHERDPHEEAEEHPPADRPDLPG